MGKGAGTIVGIIVFIALFYLGQTFPTVSPFWALVVSTFVAGLVAKKAKEGAVAGFLTAFIPLFALGVLMIIGFGNIDVSTILGGLIVFIAGIALIIASVLAGVIGAIIGAIGGFISSKL